MVKRGSSKKAFTKRGKRSSRRRVLRRRRITRRAKRQAGGDIPNDANTVISMRDGNDIDSVETLVSEPLFNDISTAAPEDAV
jgi:hypothetical protein